MEAFGVRYAERIPHAYTHGSAHTAGQTTSVAFCNAGVVLSHDRPLNQLRHALTQSVAVVAPLINALSHLFQPIATHQARDALPINPALIPQSFVALTHRCAHFTDGSTSTGCRFHLGEAFNVNPVAAHLRVGQTFCPGIATEVALFAGASIQLTVGMGSRPGGPVVIIIALLEVLNGIEAGLRRVRTDKTLHVAVSLWIRSAAIEAAVEPRLPGCGRHNR